MKDHDIAHPKESRQDRCFEVLNKEWNADTVDLAFRQFVSNFATVVSNGCDLDQAIPTWKRDEDQPQVNVQGGSFQKSGKKVVVRYQRVDGMNGSNEFSILTEYGEGPLQSEMLYISKSSGRKVFYQVNMTSDLVLNGEVLEYAPMILTPDLVRAGCVNAWNMYCVEDEDFQEENEEEREDLIFDGLTYAFEELPAYNEAGVMKLARTIEIMRREDFGGNLLNSEIEQVIIGHLEGSKKMLERSTSRDEAVLASLKGDVEYWSRMQELLRRIRQAEVIFRHGRK